MKWIYLSPHFDDAVLSCGGLIWTQARAGEPVEIWTVCAGSPGETEALSPFAQSLHERWQSGPQAALARRKEDESAAAIIGATLRFWDLPDCIYRRLPDGSFLVNGEADLWVDVNPQEAGVIERLQAWMKGQLAPGARLVSPMALGQHVDHRLARAAVEGLGQPVWYYADFPYVERDPEALKATVKPAWRQVCFDVPRAGLAAWQSAIAQYASQISTFWQDLDAMRQAMEAYWRAGGGCCLWH